VLSDTNGSLLITFPDIPEANSVAYHADDVHQNGLDALESAFEIYFEERRPIPMPAIGGSHQGVVTLPASSSAKILHWNRMLMQETG